MADYDLGSVRGSIDIDYDGKGAAEARADVRRLAKDLEREKLVAKIDADTKVLQRKRDEALAMLQTLVSKTWTPEVQVDIDNARAQVAGFESQLARLDGQRINIHMDIADEMARANGAMQDTDVNIRSLRRTLSDFGGDVRDTRSAVESLGNTMSAMAKPIAVMSAVHLASSAVTQLTAAVAPAVGVVGLLPGVLTAAGVAFAAVRIGTAGMGDAMSAVAEGDAQKLAEAMAKLGPEAQEFVRAYQDIKPAMDQLQLNVQNALFRDLGDMVRGLANTFLPTLDSGLTSVASSMNELGYYSAQALMTPATVNDLNEVLNNTSLMFDNMGGALGQFLAAFMGWAAVGSTYLPQFGSWVQDIAEQFQNWTDRMIESGQAWTVIDRGLAVLGNLWQILVNIGSIVAGIFRPLAADAQGLLPTLVSLTGQMRAWVNSAEGQQQIADIWQLLSAVSGALLSVISTLAPVIGAIASWFASLPAPVQSVVAQFIAWSTVIGLVLVKLAPMISFLIQLGPLLLKIGPALTMLVNGFMAVMRVFRAMTLLMMANPWVLLIAAVIALVAIIIYNWDTIKQYLMTAWLWIQTTAATIWNAIVAFFTGLWTGITTTVMTVWNSIVAFLTMIWTMILTVATTVWNSIVAFFMTIWNAIKEPVMTVWNGIVAFLQGVWNVIFEVFRFAAAILLAIFFTIWNPLSELVMTVWNGIVAFLTMIWNGIVASAQVIWNFLVVAWQTVWNTVSSVAMSIWNTIVGFLSGVWNGIVSTASSLWNGLVSVITAAWNAIWGFIGPILQTIGNAISTAWNAITSTISSAMSAVWGVISSVWNNIVGFFSGVWATISGIFSGAVGTVMGVLSGLWGRISSLAGSAMNLLVNAGRNIVMGLWNGIQAMGSWLYNAIMGWVRSVVPGPVLQFLGIASPSRYMRDEVGKHIPSGIAEGIEATSGVAADAAGNLATETGKAAKIAAAQEVLAALDSGKQVFEDFSYQGMSDNLRNMNDALADMFYKDGRQFDPATAKADIKAFLTRYINSGSQTSSATIQASQVSSLSPSAQAQLGSLAASTGSTSTGGTSPVASASQAAAAASTASGPTTVHIGTLALSVEGNLDPTDPVRWRKAMEAIREGITNVEASYR